MDRPGKLAGMSFDQVKTGVLAKAPKMARDLRVFVLTAVTAAMLAACGGGNSGSAPQAAGDESDRAQAEGAKRNDGTTTHADAFRLLTQASFGPTDADIASVQNLGIDGWLDK